MSDIQGSQISVASQAASPVAVGMMRLGADLNYLAAHQSVIDQMLAMIAGAQLVLVVAVTNSGGVSPIGTVDVVPLVNQTDGAWRGTPHGIIHGLSYMRVQGGSNAVIMDPQVNDIGIAVFCDRDISAVKATGAAANPGSRRCHDLADGVYLYSCLQGAPVQYVQFTPQGITVVSPVKVTIQAPIVEVDASTSFTVNSPDIALNGQITQAGYQGGAANVSLTGPVAVANDLTANGTSVHTHDHGNVENGGGVTGPPTS